MSHLVGLWNLCQRLENVKGMLKNWQFSDLYKLWPEKPLTEETLTWITADLKKIQKKKKKLIKPVHLLCFIISSTDSMFHWSPASANLRKSSSRCSPSTLDRLKSAYFRTPAVSSRIWARKKRTFWLQNLEYFRNRILNTLVTESWIF